MSIWRRQAFISSTRPNARKIGHSSALESSVAPRSENQNPPPAWMLSSTAFDRQPPLRNFTNGRMKSPTATCTTIAMIPFPRNQVLTSPSSWQASTVSSSVPQDVISWWSRVTESSKALKLWPYVTTRCFSRGHIRPSWSANDLLLSSPLIYLWLGWPLIFVKSILTRTCSSWMRSLAQSPWANALQRMSSWRN